MEDSTHARNPPIVRDYAFNNRSSSFHAPVVAAPFEVHDSAFVDSPVGYEDGRPVSGISSSAVSARNGVPRS